MKRFSRLRIGLSGRLMIFTIAFVLLAEVLIYVPSISQFRLQYLENRLSGAQIASLAVEASPGNSLSGLLEQELLANAGVLAVALLRNDARYLMLSGELPDEVDAHFDLRKTTPLSAILDAFRTLVASDGRAIRVLSDPGHGGGAIIDILMLEAPLQQAMLEYSRNILGLSLFISLITATLIYVSLHLLLVGPIRAITASMTRFRQNPQAPDAIIARSARSDEVGVAERELAQMQGVVRQALQQKNHLAELGGAVSKINHDLRNILAHAQLVSDRLSSLDDPTVRQLAPSLIQSVGRAIDLCTETLNYSSADERPPRRLRFELSPLIDEIGATLGIAPDHAIRWINAVPAILEVDADPDHIFRIIQNLGRNAVQAMGPTGEVRIEARRDGTVVSIDVIDTGPGVPVEARQDLFKAFSGSIQEGGTGLGLAIARELSRAHGGELQLLRTGAKGTAFRIEIPDSEISANDNTDSTATG